MAKQVSHICADCGKEFVAGPNARLCPDCRKKRLQANVKAVRRCVMCGKAFVGAPRALYCPDCRRKKQSENVRKYLARKRAGKSKTLGQTVLACAVCGKPFVMTAGGQKYCPDCAQEAYRKADNAKGRAFMRQMRAAAKQKQEQAAEAQERHATKRDAEEMCGEQEKLAQRDGL